MQIKSMVTVLDNGMNSLGTIHQRNRKSFQTDKNDPK